MEGDILGVKADCALRGRGRKAWWARKLGVPPLTLSHWLAERQKPSGHNALAIRQILEQLDREKKYAPWEDCLWDCYYSKQDVPPKILPLIVMEILSKPVLAVRTTALIIRFLQKQRPSFEKPSSGVLRNRVGWLLETAKIDGSFRPDRSTEVQPLFLAPSSKGSLLSYFRRHQTPVGRRWKIFDCSLEETLKSIP